MQLSTGLALADGAKNALARKVAAICLAVLKQDRDYDDKLEEKRNRLEKQ